MPTYRFLRPMRILLPTFLLSRPEWSVPKALPRTNLKVQKDTIGDTPLSAISFPSAPLIVQPHYDHSTDSTDADMRMLNKFMGFSALMYALYLLKDLSEQKKPETIGELRKELAQIIKAAVFIKCGLIWLRVLNIGYFSKLGKIFALAVSLDELLNQFPKTVSHLDSMKLDGSWDPEGAQELISRIEHDKYTDLEKLIHHYIHADLSDEQCNAILKTNIKTKIEALLSGSPLNIVLFGQLESMLKKIFLRPFDDMLYRVINTSSTKSESTSSQFSFSEIVDGHQHMSCEAFNRRIYSMARHNLFPASTSTASAEDIVSHKSTVMSTTDFMRKTTVDTPSERQVVDIDQAISRIKTIIDSLEQHASSENAFKAINVILEKLSRKQDKEPIDLINALKLIITILRKLSQKLESTPPAEGITADFIEAVKKVSTTLTSIESNLTIGKTVAEISPPRSHVGLARARA